MEEWKEAAKWLWALLLIPVGIVWRKADGSMQREEFERHEKTFTESLESHRKEDRENFRDLFKNAEADRKLMRDGFEKVSNEMHAMERRLLEKIGGK